MCYIMRLEDSAKSNNRSKKMNAIIQSGGKQLKVKAGDIVEVEKLSVENGAEVSFDVLAVEADDGKLTVGAPLVDGAKVTGKVLEVISFHGENVETHFSSVFDREFFHFDDVAGLDFELLAAALNDSVHFFAPVI